MTEPPHFEPLFPSHAIERCSAVVTFSEALPSKAFQKMLEQAQGRFRSAGLEWIIGAAQQVGAVGFQVDMASGQTTPLASGSGPAVFATADRATQFILASNSMTSRTTSYVRWTPFAGQIESLILPLLSLYSDVVSVASVQLDYVDRFLWTGNWSNFDWRELLRSDGQFLAARAAEGHQLWHTHCGWFDENAVGRRLVNVNIDLVDYQRAEGGAPSIGILTLMRDDAPVQVSRFEDAASIQACLEELHNELKRLLGQIIIDEMADRINLSAQADDASNH